MNTIFQSSKVSNADGQADTGSNPGQKIPNVHNSHLIDDNLSQLKQKRENDPFIWHDGDEGEKIQKSSTKNVENPDKFGEKSSKNSETTTSPKPMAKTCRNSVQGKVLIADDRGEKVTHFFWIALR